ncbi:MAG: phosphoribosylanthranilate isomerase [Rhodospirillaceae bacterium]|nr:phosphoribosylanthranilate isomerase [Rhodospirillaceae bacterium]MBT4491408.1 phosphoribosylanthranilate isomerase [Rhodospirillaceae bacterium]MBT5898628.1 phosphoribosylanthranilate isomerase [Rhodospirillaceae bacterium]MBT6429979.1 phosphoribosylanthranilate isomerase [Rhodospirillaceae bacterium]
MPIAVKICGLKDPDMIAAAVAGGVRYIGLVFFPRSPRAVTPVQAAALAQLVPERVIKVGLFVDPEDDLLVEVLAHVSLDLIQLHGGESPDRVARIKALTGLPVMKAIKVAKAEDLDEAAAFDGVADMLLFDAKAPKDMADALPGGNGLVFNWNLLAGRHWRQPWMLAGGLDAGNVVQAVTIAGALAVDVSTGVERAPGEKDPAAIKAFLDAVKTL